VEKKLLFALDIGTRSVIGLVGEQTPSGIRLIASERQEHHTRAMLDGQIHDVPEVASILATVKSVLETTSGPLCKVSIAAAGRALCTIKAAADIDIVSRGTLTREDEAALELAAIQSAQQQLATSGTVTEAASYYCVGYSVVGFCLDGAPIKTLIGQRGKSANIELIATFLPRPVIDSLQAAVETVGLEITTLTLEPIAAINVLIPPTMRHLNLALVDVGAGTSDVAVTKEGSVIGYGMAPVAGDEITEAISQNYLLDFNVAETVKRQLSGKNKKIAFRDVLGATHKVPAAQIIQSITSNVTELAQAIATQILSLNGGAPQAVLLVGGGSLTPLLPEIIAQTLDIPAARVAIRRPDSIETITNIPESLSLPDAVTPLGILKLAGSDTLNFIQVVLNERTLRLFNLGKLTVADALLAAGIDIRTLHGRPGLGITITVNGQKKFFPGSHGQPGKLLLNDAPAKLGELIAEGDRISVSKGVNGTSPQPLLQEAVAIPASVVVALNGKNVILAPVITVNGAAASAATELADRDQVACRLPSTLGEILASAGLKEEPVNFRYTVNSIERTYKIWPQYLINGKPADLKSPVANNDSITVSPIAQPCAGDLVGHHDAPDDYITIHFNGSPCLVPTRRFSLLVNGQPAPLTATVPDGSSMEYTVYSQSQPTISEALLAAEFNPREVAPGSRIDVKLNGQSAEYTSLVKNGDSMEIIVSA
jgi:cell division protein FtsA